jgi:selenocysteine lyase/cysteine desulfurase
VKRKHFIHSLGATTLGALSIPAALSAANSDTHSDSNKPPKGKKLPEYIVPQGPGISNAPHNEAFWSAVATNFIRPEGFINLENGYFSHQPQGTLRYHIDAQTTINTQTSHFMRTAQTTAIEEARKAFAGFQGLLPDEVAITRNTTESLNIVIMGTRWQAGDEVIIGNQDYGSMVEAFEQAAARWGIIIKIADVPKDPRSDIEIVNAYCDLITPNTKMLHLTHMINLSGQLIPVHAITRKAKQIQPNIVVVVDAAHSLAHTPTDMSDLTNSGVDVIGGSLHKWLCNPIGVGFLYMKKSLIPSIWPLMGDTGADKTDIRKFEHQGTRPINSLQTIAKAIEFHRMLGSAAKFNRLTYLKLLWIGNKQALENFGKGLGILNDPQYQTNMAAVTELTLLDAFKLESPLFQFQRGGAIATAYVSGYSPTTLAKALMDNHKIFTVGIDHPIIKGVRVTPHLSSSAADCIALNRAFTRICVDLIPSPKTK